LHWWFFSSFGCLFLNFNLLNFCWLCSFLFFKHGLDDWSSNLFWFWLCCLFLFSLLLYFFRSIFFLLSLSFWFNLGNAGNILWLTGNSVLNKNFWCSFSSGLGEAIYNCFSLIFSLSTLFIKSWFFRSSQWLFS
jgi:hypothetical protein